VLPQHSEGWRLLDVTHATVRAAFPRKFFRKRTLAAAALSGYAWREGACGGKTWFSGPKPWAAARRLAAQCFAACRLPLAASCCSRRLRNVRPTSLRYPTLHRTKPAAAHHDGCSLAEG